MTSSEQPHPSEPCDNTSCWAYKEGFCNASCRPHSSATELEESEQWRRVYENGYTDGQQAEREQVIQQFIDFGMSGKCVKTDKAVSCDAICEHDCIVCFAESLRGGAP